MSPVDEEALRKKITDELYKGLEQDRAKAEQELQAWLDTCTHPHTHTYTVLDGKCFFVYDLPQKLLALQGIFMNFRSKLIALICFFGVEFKTPGFAESQTLCGVHFSLPLFFFFLSPPTLLFWIMID